MLLTLEQVYRNCPRHIAEREAVAVAGTPSPERRERTFLDGPASALLGCADMAFVATRAPGHGADVSHRGGAPGFLRVPSERTVVWPDYRGNAMFNTLGDLHLDPACGLTVLDPSDGTVLWISGTAEVEWDPNLVMGWPAAERLVVLRVEAVFEPPRAAPLRWSLRARRAQPTPFPSEHDAGEPQTSRGRRWPTGPRAPVAPTSNAAGPCRERPKPRAWSVTTKPRSVQG